MTRMSALPGGSARGKTEPISHATTNADGLRRAIQGALPRRAVATIAARLGRAERWVYAQIEGKTPLTLEFVIEASREIPPGVLVPALDAAASGAGLCVVRRPAAEDLEELVEANARALETFGRLQVALARARTDGARAIVAAVVEARVRIADMERLLLEERDVA